MRPAPWHRSVRLALSGLALALSAVLLPARATTAGDAGLMGGDPQTIQAESLTSLQTFFQALDYDWQRIEAGVPPFILESFPQDINYSANVTAKKHAFFMGLLPMVLLVNQEIEQDRSDFLAILDRSNSGERLRSADFKRLQEVLAAYGTPGNPLTDHQLRARLLRRIDTIPPSLVLAQAANESAWGTSRFAQLGNNLFGEWTFKPGTGIVPEDRPEGATYEVRKFPNIYESIRSYMRNLNTHGAYRKLREIRNSLRRENKPVTGLALAHGLANYSQRREDYISDIQGMILYNKLADANLAFLRTDENAALSGFNPGGAGLFSSRERMISRLSAPLANP